MSSSINPPRTVTASTGAESRDSELTPSELQSKPEKYFQESHFVDEIALRAQRNVQPLIARQPPPLTTSTSLKSPRKLPDEDYKHLLDNEPLRSKEEEELIIFSQSIRKSPRSTTAIEHSRKYFAPISQEVADIEESRKPGNVPICNFFHTGTVPKREEEPDEEISKQEERPSEDVTDDSDKLVHQSRKKERPRIQKEVIRMQKGEFSFPHQTYAPKVQIPNRVSPGQIPQSLAIERLHRLYKRTDIGEVCKSMGIITFDLMPPPNYVEGSEKYHQEIMFRNRIKILGVDKRQIILNHYGGDRGLVGNEFGEGSDVTGKPSLDSLLDEYPENNFFAQNYQIPGETPSLSTTTGTKSTTTFQAPSSSGGSGGPRPLYNRPPFTPSLPLDYFDNEEFDIRSGSQWMRLGWDKLEKKKYPIPGKAFLPMPMPFQNEDPSKTISESSDGTKFFTLPSLAEITSEDILLKSERLAQFRTWLLSERDKRFQRVSEMPSESDFEESTLPPSERYRHQSENTRTNALELTNQSTEPKHRSHFQRKEQSTDGVTKKGTLSTSSSVGSVKKIYTGVDEGSDSDNSEGKGPLEEDALEQLKKRNIPLDETDLALQTIINLLQKGKKHPSELEEHPNQNTLSNMTSLAISSMNQMEGDDNISSRTEVMNSIAEDTPREYLSSERSYLESQNEHQGSETPAPDDDPFEGVDGKYIFDFDLMKKVHIYDWRWVEVAAFDYNTEKRKYLVRTINPPFIYAWIGKVYLLFDGENPIVHGRRVLDALNRRVIFENVMRYNLYIDCLPQGHVSPMPKETLEVLLRSALRPKLSYSDHMLKMIRNEIEVEYSRVEKTIKFNQIVQKHPEIFQPWVEFSLRDNPTWTREKEWKGIVGRRTLSRRNLKNRAVHLLKLSVIFKKEPFDGLCEVVQACQQARGKRLLLTRLNRPLLLKSYDKLQRENMEELARYLRDIWIESILSAIREHLGKIPKSWYNILESRWDIYSMSKTSGYLNLIRYMVEDTLRFIVEDSLEDFVREIEQLTSVCEYDSDYDWGEDLTVSEFPTPKHLRPPPFLLELIIDEDGPKFSHLLARFKAILGNLFENAIEMTNKLPDIVPLIMEKLLFGTQTTLRSVQSTDKKITHLRQKLFSLLRKGLIPVDLYAQKFTKFSELHNLDLNSFMSNWESSRRGLEETIGEIRRHMEQIESIEKEIPSFIDINAFRVNTDTIKQNLIKKEKGLYTKILDFYAENLRSKVKKIKAEYGEIERKLNIHSDDIYEVMDLKKYLVTIPSSVQVLEMSIGEILKEYELFDEFSHKLPPEDDEAKWQAAMSSNRILRMAEEAVHWLDEDYERLLKVQQSDLSELSDSVDSATLAVGGLAGFTDMEKASEVAGEVKKVWKMVKELEDQSRSLNQRQGIFGLPPAQNEALSRLVNDIEPYKNLWFTAAEWLRIQDNCFRGTMDKIDIDAIVKIIGEGEDLLEECIQYFDGADAIQHVAQEVSRQIFEFKPLVPLIQTLKNPGMRQRHWEAISEICGFPVVARGNISFKKLLDQGLRKHIDKLSQIGFLASNEYEIERELDWMLKQTADMTIRVETDSETGIQIIELEEETLEKLNNFFDKTFEIVQSPYKDPFIELLSSWETRIANAKNNIQLWLENQEDWLALHRKYIMEPNLFAEIMGEGATDGEVPAERKTILRMERIWRRLMRFARDNSEVLSICSDVTVIVSLNQFSELAEKMQKFIEGGPLLESE